VLVSVSESVSDPSDDSFSSLSAFVFLLLVSPWSLLFSSPHCVRHSLHMSNNSTSKHHHQHGALTIWWLGRAYLWVWSLDSDLSSISCYTEPCRLLSCQGKVYNLHSVPLMHQSISQTKTTSTTIIIIIIRFIKRLGPWLQRHWQQVTPRN